MSNIILRWMRPSKLLSTEVLEILLTAGQVLEQDKYGYLAARLPNSDILKIFRVKCKISGARIYSHARRFMINAERLQKLGMSTFEYKRLFHFSNSTDIAVLYAPLPGHTLNWLIAICSIRKWQWF